MLFPILTRAAAITLLTTIVPQAQGYNEFQKVFVAEYAKGKDVDRDFARLVRKAKCYVCHQGKDDRKNCNRYGLAVGEHLVEDDKKDKEKIAAMLKLVAGQTILPEGEETYGDLIARGELPGGPLDECKKEPPATESVETETAADSQPAIANAASG